MSTVIHLGFPKTGTTTLQQHFFPALPGCVALGPLPYGSPFRILAGNLERAADDEFLEATWRAFLTDARGSADTLILSREGLSRPEQRGRTADRLHALVPDAKIVICVRDQRPMMRSFYSQHLRAGGVESLTSWLEGFDRAWLRYDELVALYQERFGGDRVYVTAFELLGRDAQGYLDGLAEFVRPGSASPIDAASVPVENPALSAGGRWAYRRTNRWFRRTPLNRRPVLRSHTMTRVARAVIPRLDRSAFGRWTGDLNPEERAVLDRESPRYRASNDRLAELTALPLSELGYVTSSDDPLPPMGRD